MKAKQFRQTFIGLVVCCLFLAAMGRTAAADSLKTIDVPAYSWNHGCSPTSGGMLFGYYDTNGYYNLFPGDASTQTTEVRNLIASPEHIRDYWGQPDPNPGGHEDNCIADFMGTSRGTMSNGLTWIHGIADGLRDYASYRGYTATSWTEQWVSFTWDDLVSEIDNDRPMLFHVDSNSDCGLDHSVATMGYKEEGGEKYYAARNTWGSGMHWYEFKPISLGQYFGVGSATFFHFTEPPCVEKWIAGTADWHTASNWESDLPTAIKDAHIDNGGTALITLSAEACKLYIGYNATGSVQQSSGVCTMASTLYLGYGSGSSGTYTLDSGVCTIASTLYLGYGSGSSGTYTLNGGDLTASDEYIGLEGTGTFNQSGGTNAVQNLHINASSSYTLSGGTLSIKEKGRIHGAIDFADGNATLNVEGGIVNLRDAAFTNTGSAAFTSVPDSLTIFSPGFNPITGFASCEADGITYTPGAKMIVYENQSFTGYYYFDDPLEIRGTLIASGGTFGFRDSLTIFNGGFFDASAKTFQLQDGQTVTIAEGGVLSAGNVIVADSGAGVFNQEGGIHAVQNLRINASSSYTLSGGTLSIKEDGGVHGAIDFADGNATLNAEGGIADLRNATLTNTGSAMFTSAPDSLTIFPSGFNPITGFASCEANGVTYTPGAKMIVYEGQSFTGHYDFDDPLEIRGTLIASGGTFAFRDSLTVSNGGFFDAGAETFQLQDGQTATMAEGGALSASNVIVAYTGECVFNQEGGTHVIDGSLYIARNVPCDRGTYNLNGGELTANDVVVGYGFGTGLFCQTGGTHNIADGLDIGARFLSKSAYILSGGTLEVQDLMVLDYGRFSMMDGEARLTISGAMTLEKLAEYTAAPGAAIHMTGAIFDNKSDSAVNLSGLENTCFIFEGGDDITDTFEIAGYDYGLAEEYFCMNNFLLDGLVLGGDDVARLRLMDNHANYTGSSVKTCPEALYVRGLTINKGSTLDLNGYHLYAMEYINLGGAVLNGEVIAISEMVIPEPTALLLLVPGILGIAIRVKGRRRKD